MHNKAMSRKRVLVIDDNSDDILLLKIAARRTAAPIELSIVKNGQAAIEYLQRHEGSVQNAENPLPDLVLLDIHLPKCDGFEVLRWIRKRPDLRALKVFMWTGSEDPTHRKLAKELEADLFLAKSGDERPLVEMIGSVAESAAEEPRYCQAV